MVDAAGSSRSSVPSIPLGSSNFLETSYKEEVLLFLFYLYESSTDEPKLSSILIDRKTFKKYFRKIKKHGLIHLFGDYEDLWQALLEMKFLKLSEKSTDLYNLKIDIVKFNEDDKENRSSITVAEKNTPAELVGDSLDEKTDVKICDDDDETHDHVVDLIILMCYLRKRSMIRDDRIVFKFLLLNEILRLQRQDYLKWIQTDNVSTFLLKIKLLK